MASCAEFRRVESHACILSLPSKLGFPQKGEELNNHAEIRVIHYLHDFLTRVKEVGLCKTTLEIPLKYTEVYRKVESSLLGVRDSYKSCLNKRMTSKCRLKLSCQSDVIPPRARGVGFLPRCSGISFSRKRSIFAAKLW